MIKPEFNSINEDELGKKVNLDDEQEDVKKEDEEDEKHNDFFFKSASFSYNVPELDSDQKDGKFTLILYKAVLWLHVFCGIYCLMYCLHFIPKPWAVIRTFQHSLCSFYTSGKAFQALSYRVLACLVNRVKVWH